MDETLTSPKIKEIDLIHNLEEISSKFLHRILIVKGYIFKKITKTH